MECPKCKSDNTQRLEVIYDEGTQHTRSTTVGGGYGRGGAIGTATTTGKTQSNLARKAAPPAKPGWLPVVILAIFGVFTLQIYIGFALLIGAFFLGKKTAEAKKIYPGRYQKWLDSWMCNKCGVIYTQD